MITWGEYTERNTKYHKNLLASESISEPHDNLATCIEVSRIEAIALPSWSCYMACFVVLIGNLKGVAAGAARVNLQGEEVGEVTVNEITWAKLRLATKKARQNNKKGQEQISSTERKDSN